MKRRMLKFALFLFLCVIINIAVAWGCAVWSEASLGLMYTQSASLSDLERLKRAGWKQTSETEDWMYAYSIYKWRGYGVSDCFVIEEAVPKPIGTIIFHNYTYNNFFFARVSQAGWPLRCLSREFLDRTGNGQGAFVWVDEPWHPSQPSIADGDTFDSRSLTKMANWQHSMSFAVPEKIGPITLPEDRYLPLRPIWSGLIINTLIYAAFLLMISFIASNVRQNSRFKKGHCPKCYHELKSNYSKGCPECGWGRKD